MSRAATFFWSGERESQAGISGGRGVTIWGFGAAVLFGMTKPLRGFAGGIAIGIVQALSAGYLPGAWATVAPLGFIMIVLAAGRLNVAHVAGGRA